MIWYVLRTIAEELFEAAKDKIMCHKTGKCKVERTLGVDCTGYDYDKCEFDPVPTVPEIEREDLISKITNPDIEIEGKGLERLMCDMKDGSYTEKRKKDGKY